MIRWAVFGVLQAAWCALAPLVVAVAIGRFLARPPARHIPWHVN